MRLSICSAAAPNHRSALAEIMPTVNGESGETVIEAVQLTKKFGDFAATDHVDFQVRRGEIFGLLGPNGAGKSTTFKMMCGLLIPSSGKALVLGMDLKTSSDQARQRLGYMAQKFSLYGNLTVAQNLKFFSGVYGLSGKAQRDKIDEMSRAFNFAPILDQTPDALPLGFKQRLALACALMHEPDIPIPRRTDFRRRSADAARVLVAHQWHGRQGRHGDGDHPLYGRSGVLRPHRPGVPRQNHRRRHTGRSSNSRWRATTIPTPRWSRRLSSWCRGYDEEESR